MNYRCATKYGNVLDAEIAFKLYEQLSKEIKWENGIKSRIHGFTRKAKTVSIHDPLFKQLIPYINDSLDKLNVSENFAIFGIYLNFYENGEMYTPNHSHKGTQQLVISLGATRQLVVGKKTFSMKNGDAIIFGSAIHGVPKEDNVKNGRISIATFMKKISS